MSFSSSVFLYIFLPIGLILFYIVPKKINKVLLILISLLFYSLSSLETLPVLIGTIILNYCLGLAIAKSQKRKRLLLLLGG